MRVTFYTYSGDKELADKTFTHAQQVADFPDYVGYGKFNPLSPQFTFEGLYSKANYAIFTVDNNANESTGFTFYAWITNLSVDSKGLYVYQCTIDAITTCWYAGCLNTSAYISYSNYGNNYHLLDSRLSFRQDITVGMNHSIQLGTTAGDGQQPYIVVNVLRFDLGSAGWLNSAAMNSFDSYIMTPYAFRYILSQINTHFTQDSDAAEKLACYKLIQNLYITRYARNALSQLEQTNEFEFFYAPYQKGGITDPWSINSSYSIDLSGTGAAGNVWKVPYNDRDKQIVQSYETYFPGAGSGLVNFEIWKTTGQLTIEIPFIGTLPINLSKYHTSSLQKIGVNIYTELGAGTYTAVPTINGNELKDQSLTVSNTEAFPIAIDTNIEHWSTFYGTTAINTVGSIAALAGGIATENPLLIVSGAVGLGSTIQGSINQYNQLKDAEITGISSSGGSPGGNPYNSRNRGYINVIWRYYEPIDLDIQDEFGLPDGHYRNIQGMTGYVQCAMVHLPTMGLPLQIVQEAEQMLMSGIHINEGTGTPPDPEESQPEPDPLPPTPPIEPQGGETPFVLANRGLVDTFSYDGYFTLTDAENLARLMYSEYNLTNTAEQLRQAAAVGWCVLNRQQAGSSKGFRNTITDVLKQNAQFYVWAEKGRTWDQFLTRPVRDDLLEVAKDILTRRSNELRGINTEQNSGRILPSNYYWYTGNHPDHYNWYWNDYSKVGKKDYKYNWSLPNPYTN